MLIRPLTFKGYRAINERPFRSEKQGFEPRARLLQCRQLGAIPERQNMVQKSGTSPFLGPALR